MLSKIQSIAISPEIQATARNAAIAATTIAATVAAVALPVFKICYPFLLPFLVAAAPWVWPVVIIVAAIGLTYGAHRLDEYIDRTELRKAKNKKRPPTLKDQTPSLPNDLKSKRSITEKSKEKQRFSSSREQTPPRAADFKSERPMLESVKLVYKELQRISELSPEEAKKALNIEDSKGDIGGHGGMSNGEITIEGQTYYLFLKPKDDVEAENYELTELLEPGILSYMPTYYGEVRIGAKVFIVMQNTRKDESGNEIKTDADIKFNGKITKEEAQKIGISQEELEEFCPIYEKPEWDVTREKTKDPLTEITMVTGSRVAPSYQLPTGFKITRLFYHGEAEQNFKNILQKWTLEECVSFIANLQKIRADIESSSIAFIGASILSVGKRPYLIDPAHIVVDPKKKEELRLSGFDVNRIYFGDDEGKRFELYKASNRATIDAIMATVEEVRKEKERTIEHYASEQSQFLEHWLSGGL